MRPQDGVAVQSLSSLLLHTAQDDRRMLDVFEYVYVETSLKFKDYKIPSNVFIKK